MRVRTPLCLVAAVALVGGGAAWAHHPAKNATVAIQGFSAKQRVGARLPSDAVLSGRTYRRQCGNKRLYAFARFKDMRENQPFEVVWTLNGRRVSKDAFRWPSALRETYDLSVASATRLRAGVYAVFVHTGGKLRGHARVTLAC